MSRLPDEITVNSAVQRCVTAWRQALAAKGVKDPFEPEIWGHNYAGEAYRNALPWLSTPDNVDAFIACVAHGMAIGAIEPSDATRLIYAAQVAITSRRARLQEAKEARAEKAEKAEQNKRPSRQTTPLPTGTNGAAGKGYAPQVPLPQGDASEPKTEGAP